MISFVVCLAVLVIGYFVFGRVAEAVFKPDNSRATPVTRLADGVDYVRIPGWKMFLIELLNIAGLGPIFGAITGALFGPVAFLWITLGGLLIGGFHDYFSGMISLRNDGKTSTELAGKYLGNGVLWASRIVTIVLLVLLGVVFIAGPGALLGQLTAGVSHNFWLSRDFWVVVIFIYCVFAALFPIDKALGYVYPVFGVLFILMALGLIFMLLVRAKGLEIPEITFSNLHNFHYGKGTYIWSMLFITIACGAVSGFHSTQTPLMARCMPNESPAGRRIFYGAMIAESVIALAWAGASSAFFHGQSGFEDAMQAASGNPAIIVNAIANTWFGKVGGIIAILGVVAAPVTSAGSSLRTARLNLADILKWNQKKMSKRLVLTIPIFVAAIALTFVDFSIVWRYFAFTNQTLAMLTLWMCAMYLVHVGRGKFHWFLSLPAAFMTTVVTSYIFMAPEGFKLPQWISTVIGVAVAVALFVLFMRKASKKEAALKSGAL